LRSKFTLGPEEVPGCTIRGGVIQYTHALSLVEKSGFRVQLEQLCQRRGATFARLRMEAQLYSLRASATRLTGKYWAAPYASSLLPPGLSYMPPHYSRDLVHGPGAGSGLLPRLPPPTCSRPVSGVGLGPFCYAAFLLRSPGPCSPTVFRSATCDCLSIKGCLSLQKFSIPRP
jgi:hypothetical protein